MLKSLISKLQLGVIDRKSLNFNIWQGIFMMKKLQFLLMLLMLSTTLVNAKNVPVAVHAVGAEYKVNQLMLTGTINDRTALFSLNFDIETAAPVEVKIVTGKVSVDYKGRVLVKKQGLFIFSDKSKVILKDGAYYLKCETAGKYQVALDFYAKVDSAGTRRSSSFELLPAVTRKYQIKLEQGNADFELVGGLDSNAVSASENRTAKLIYDGYMLPKGVASLSWRKTLQPGKTPLSLGAFSGTVCSVQAGTIKMSNDYRFDIFQGKLSQLKFAVPAGINVTGIKGEAIGNWNFAIKDRVVTVFLNKEQQGSYKINIQAEKFLPQIPCSFTIEPIVPLGVMRYGGLLKVGSGRGIKLLSTKNPGLVQIESSSAINGRLPANNYGMNDARLFSFSGANYSFSCEAEAVQPVFTAEMNLRLNYRDRTLRLQLDCTVDVKDAPLQEITLQYDRLLDFNRVSGAGIRTEDYDLQTTATGKIVKLPFRQPLLGKSSFSIYFEREMKDVKDFNLPRFTLTGVKSVRGYFMMAAEKGIKLLPNKIMNLTQVHTGSVPVKLSGIQHAYLFRSADWQGIVSIDHEKSAIFNEVFHFASAAEGTVYCSSIFMFKISGAPIQSLHFKVSSDYNNLEFKGSNIISRRKVSESDGHAVWEVKLREKVIGATMMMVAYELSLADGKKSVIGDTNCTDADSSSGFIALTGRKSLKVTVSEQNKNVKVIDANELPSDYLGIVTTPILKAFRCTGLDTAQPVVISRYRNCKLPETVIDRTMIEVNLDDNGNAVTTVEYRVKNSTGQFLVLKLPNECSLWSVEVDGRSKRLSSAAGNLLIPLPRYQDINRPIKVVVSYARNFGKITSRKQLVMAAPESSVKQLFTKWTVNVPENFSITASEPLPDGRFEVYGTGLTGLVSRLYKYLINGLRNGVLAGWIITTILVGLLVMCFRRRWKTASVILFLMLGMFLFFSGVFLLRHSLNFMSQVNFIMNQVNFSSVSNLSNQIQQIKLEVVNTEAGVPQNWIFSIGGLLAAAVAVAGIFYVKWRVVKAVLTALALTLLTLAAVQWFRLSLYTGLALIVILPLILSFGLWRVIWQRSAKVVATLLCMMSMFIAAESSVASPTVNRYKCTGTVREKVVEFSAELNIAARRAGRLKLLWSPALMTGMKLPEVCKISNRNGTYYLEIAEAGDFDVSFNFLIPLDKRQDNMTFKLPIPLALTNHVTVKSETDIDIKADNPVSSDQDASGNVFSGCFVPGSEANFTLRQRGTATDKVKSEFFAGISGYVKISRGAIEVRDNVTLTVPRGELKSVEFKVSPAMRITSVKGKLVEGWRFEQKRSLLKIFFVRPCTGSCNIVIDYQMADPELPGEVIMRPSVVSDAVRQYGTYTVFVEKGMNAVETERKLFSQLDTLSFRQLRFENFIQKNSYRYAGIDAMLAFRVNEVKPEIRVHSAYELNYEDERTLMNVAVDINVVKGGIFSFILQLPDEFEINRLSGRDVQYWNEFTRNNIRHVEVNFKQRISKTSRLIIELASMNGLSPGGRVIPALRMKDAEKETGTLKIFAEKGVTVSVVSRSGVARASGAFKRFDKNVSLFKLLRCGWQLKLKFDVTPPWIQLKTLQKVTIRENEIETRAFLKFNIENSGIKRFRIQLPPGSYGPSFSGRYIAAAGEKANGLWEVNLNRKVEHSYRMEISYRNRSTPEKLLKVTPVKVLDVGVQTGYVAVLAEDSLQLELNSATGDYATYNSRNIPTFFGASDLAAAILCYRLVGTGWELNIKTVHHRSVSTLKATIESININTLVNKTGTLLTEVNISLKNGSEKFLNVKLPAAGELWSAFVDEKTVQAVYSDGTLMLPLNPDSSGKTKQRIKFIYSNAAELSWNKLHPEFTGPEFTLPLRNVRWQIYLPNTCKYSDFSGTMNYKDKFLASLLVASLDEYDRVTADLVSSVKGRAKSFRSLGNKLYRKGKRNAAYQAFQSAIDISGDNAMRSDIQGEMLQNSRMYNIQSIVNRQQKVIGKSYAPAQSNIAQYRNLQELKGQVGSEKFELSRIISDRLVTQQQTVAARARQLNVVIPWQGTKITFERGLAVEKNAPLKVTFAVAKRKNTVGIITKTIGFAAVFAVMLIVSSLFFVKRKA